MPELNGATSWINSPRSPARRCAARSCWPTSGPLASTPFASCPSSRHGQRSTRTPARLSGVHSPEFGFEKDRANVARAISALNVNYPTAVDSDMAVWRAFKNEYWPADYTIDAKGSHPAPPFRRRRLRRSGARHSRSLKRERGRRPPCRPDSRGGCRHRSAPDFRTTRSPETSSIQSRRAVRVA